MVESKVLDEWFKNLIKWTLKIIIGLIVLFYLINFICIITYDKCKNRIKKVEKLKGKLKDYDTNN